MKSRRRIHCSRLFVAGSIAILAMGLIAAGGQKKRRRPVQKSPTPVRVQQVDYSHFSHSTKKHQGECNTCHKVPTDNWTKVRDFPDVADFPGHDACVSCHRPQFFKGAKPLICSGCHSKVSPRDDARFAFRNPASRREFAIEFPHDKHQDVIAKLFRQSQQTFPLLRRASFRSNTDDTTKHFNNCEICHGSRTAPQVAPDGGWVDSFVPDAATFRTVPTSHASCFACHWKSQQPINENCAGCHKLGPSVLVLSNNQSVSMGPALRVSLRSSIKFRHAREQHTAECTTCHINITKSSTLRGLKPDVPITACTECHNKDGLRLDVNKELEALDKNREFVCSYCHTSDIGRRDPPGSHYVIAGRAPLKRKDIK